MSEANKVLGKQFIEVYNQGAWDLLDNLVSADYIHNNNGKKLTLAQFKRGASWFRAGMPDFNIEVLDLLAEGDKVAIRWLGSGTHHGSFYGEPPTSKNVVLYGTTIFRVQDGRIAEDWEAMDERDFMVQIGAAK